MDLLDAVTLSLLTGLSRRRLGDRLRTGPGDAPSPGAPFALPSLPALVRATARRAIPQSRIDEARRAAGRALERASAAGITPVVLGSAAYPPALAAIFDPPLVLWTRGCLPAAGHGAGEDPAVAIVGARAASPYAREVARRLGTDLADHGVTVVSGLARGVDIAAHRGALESAGACRTVAVFGCGVDVIYPREHAATAEAITRSGALVSEFPPGTPPRAEHFPRRNRLISGLSRAVVVVEAAERSGALITADFALDQGRDVLAVPGPVLSGRNRGAHGLLREGAKIVEDADDILEELGRPRRRRRDADAGDARDPVLRVMRPGDAYAIDELAYESGLDARRLLPRLLELELAGHVRREGGRFMRAR